MILKYYVGLLQSNLVRSRAYLRRDQLLELDYSVCGTALYPLPFAHSVIHHHFYHHRSIGVVDELALTDEVQHLDLLSDWKIGWPAFLIIK